MTTTLIIANAIASIVFATICMKKHSSYALMLVFAWHFVLYSLKPLLMYQYDLYFFFFDKEAMASIDLYLFVGLLFIVTYSVSLIYLINIKIVFYKITKLFDFRTTSVSAIVLLIAIFITVSFVANVIKYQDIGYFYKTYNSFEVTMNQAQGSWYLNVLAGLSGLPMMILMIRYIDKNYLVVFSLIVVMFCMLFYINKTASRTEYAVLLLSVFFYYISTGRIKLKIYNVALFGFIIINVLFFANLARSGLSLNLSKLDREYSLLVPLVSLVTDLNPVDCGIMLLHNRYQFDWFLFKYILLTPIAVIPRAVMPFKPETGIEAIITTSIFGEGFYNNSTQTFTIPIMGYMNAGYIGVIIIAVLFSFITSIFFKGTLSENKYIRIFSIYYMMVLLSLYRTSFETTAVALMTILFLFILMHLICYPLKHIKIKV